MFMLPCNYTDMSQYSQERPSFENDYWVDYLFKVNNSYCFPKKDETEDLDYSYIDNKGNGHSTVVAVNRDIIRTLFSKPKLLDLYVLVMFYERTYFSPGNSTQFYTKRLESELFPITSDKSKMYNVNFIKTKTTRDYSGFFITDKIENIFTTVDKVLIQAEAIVPSYILNNDDINVTHLVLNLNKAVFLKTYSFKYIGISDIISSLGGSFRPIFFIFQFIYNFLIMFNYKAYLLNSIFQYHTSKDDSNKEYNKVNTLMNNYIVKRGSLCRRDSVHSPEKSLEKEELREINLNILKETNNEKRNNDNPTENASNKNQKTVSYKLHDSLNKIIKNREKYMIKSTDVVKAYFNSCFKIKATSKDKLLLLSESLIDTEIDFTKILKNSFDLHILKTAFIEEPLSNYITFPSLSITNPDAGLSLLTKFQSKVNYSEINEELITQLVNNDLNKIKYNKILKQIIEYQ